MCLTYVSGWIGARVKSHYCYTFDTSKFSTQGRTDDRVMGRSPIALFFIFWAAPLLADSLPRPAGLEPDIAFWRRVFTDAAKGRFNATYVSPGKVRTAQALAVGLSPGTTSGEVGGACLTIFETLAGRS